MVELGAHTLFNNYEHCISLIQELNLKVEEKTKSKIYFKANRFSKHSDSLFSRFNLTSAIYHLLSASFQRFFSKSDNSTVTIKEKLSRLLGESNFRDIVSPALQALYNQTINNIPSSVLFKSKKRNRNNDYPRRFTIKGGNESLVEKISENLNIILKSPVRSIESNGEGFQCVSKENYSCKYVVLAVPGECISAIRRNHNHFK